MGKVKEISCLALPREDLLLNCCYMAKPWHGRMGGKQIEEELLAVV